VRAVLAGAAIALGEVEPDAGRGGAQLARELGIVMPERDEDRREAAK